MALIIIAKRIHVVNFAFTLLNEGSAAMSVFGNHPLAIIEVPENYDSMVQVLSDIVNESRTLQSVEINGIAHPIEYFMGSKLLMPPSCIFGASVPPQITGT